MGVSTTHRIYNWSVWILIYSFSNTYYVWAACVQYSLESDLIQLRCRLIGTLKPLVKYLMLQCEFLRWAAYLLIRGKYRHLVPQGFSL